MSTEIVSMGFSGLTVPSDSHVGYAYEDEAERYQNLLRFMSTGLRNNEKCIAAVAEYTHGFWVDGLRAHGIDPADLPNGQLSIITAGSFTRSSITESVQNAVHALGSSLQSPLQAGWTGIRAATGFMHLYYHKQAISDLLSTESETNDLASHEPMTMLCTFSKSIMHPLLLETALNCHPFVTDGASVSSNTNYVSPAQLGSRLPQILSQLNEAGAFVQPCAQLDFCGDVPVIRACSELDLYTSPKLEHLADTMVRLRHRKMVIDLSATTYLDASTIGVLLRVARALESKGGQLSLLDPRDPVRKIFQIVNLPDYIPVHRTIESAMDTALLSAAA